MDTKDSGVDIGDNGLQDARQLQDHRGHEIATRTLRSPPCAYACLEIITDGSSAPEADLLTARSYITSALTQFLGLTGSAISVDILKLEKSVCWIRMPREDLRPVLAALGGWVSRSDAEETVGWKIKGSGNWLGALVTKESADN